MWEINVYKSNEYALNARSVVQAMCQNHAEEKEMYSKMGNMDNFMEEVAFELHLEGRIAF